MKDMLEKFREFCSNRWVKFTFVALVYVLWFVVWTGNPWLLLGLPVIYDIYISKRMYRLFWRKHKLRKANNKLYRTTMEWVEAIVFAVIAATLIKTYIFGMYVIPSGSMEKTLLIGDYLCVSKVAYGPVMPNTPLAFPFVHHTMPMSQTKKAYSEAIQWPYHRLKGWGTVERGDVVVFTFPAGDTVVLEDQNAMYYDYLRDYQYRFGEKEGREALYRDKTIITRPVDKRENYIKRCVGIPGDSVQVENSILMVNGLPLKELPRMQYTYDVYTNGTPINKNAFEAMKISPADIEYGQHMYRLPLTASNLERVKGMGNVVNIVQLIDYGIDPAVFPRDTTHFKWNKDHYGPLWVPKKGVTVSLTPENLPLYRRIIEAYEGNKLETKDGAIIINGSFSDSYTFKMNYYFMMGDNRDNSADSRFWGFVPEDHVVGKASFVWLSVDPDKSIFSGIRWSRMFRSIK